MHITTYLNPDFIIHAVGTLGVIAIIFLETGAFFGFFFPGDTLLFTAGFLATQGYTSLAGLLVGAFLAAIIGDSVGYMFGKKVGPSLFSREDSIFFNRKHVARAQHFYERYGKKTIILARFVPIVRTFAPIVAGIGMMSYRTFLTYNVVGAFVWTWLMIWLGYGLGALIPNPDRYVLPIVAIILITSFIPPIWELLKRYRNTSGPESL